MKQPRTISVIVESDIYEKFVDNLPRHIGVSAAIRDLLEAQVEEVEKIKNLNSLDQGAIKLINNKLSQDFKISEKNKQPTIDFFCIQRTEVPILVNGVKEKQELARMEGQCREFIKLSKMRMNKL